MSNRPKVREDEVGGIVKTPRTKKNWDEGGNKKEKGKMTNKNDGNGKMMIVDPKNAEAPRARLGIKDDTTIAAATAEPAQTPTTVAPALVVPVVQAPAPSVVAPAPVVAPVAAQTPAPAVVTTVVVTTTELPDLDAINVKTMTPQEKAEADAKVRARKEWAKTAGEKLVAINRAIAEIEAIPPELLELDPDRQKTLSELKAAREKLVNAGDEGLQKHLAFSATIADMKSATPNKAGEYVAHGIAANRVRYTNRTNSPNLIFWNGKVLEPVPNESGSVSSATLAFVNELRKLTDAAKAMVRNAYEIEVRNLKTRTNGLTVGCIFTGSPTGEIYGFLPAEENKRESHFSVTVGTEKIRPATALGRIKEFWTDLAAGSVYITPKEFREGKLLRRIDGQDDFRKTVAFLRILRAAAFLEKKVETKEGEEAAQ